MLKVETLERAFYLRYSFTYQIRNVENGKVMLFSKNPGSSPTLLTLIRQLRSGYQKKMLAAWT